ncbi:MAG: hypothetical protein H7Y60_09785 [Rhodospirillaceae bacterium]|nr:hypothetical protein [Rhodospirillales bacterium]
MTTPIPHPIPTAIAAIDRAATSLQAAIRIADDMNRLQESLALLMVSGEISHAVDTLRQCGQALDQSGGMQ